MLSTPSVLFVCLGNICRSPTAEAVFYARARSAGVEVHIESAGTSGWHIGETPDSRSQAAGRKRGYNFTGQESRKVCMNDFVIFDYILAMDEKNKRDLLSICPAPYQAKVKLFLEFAPDISARDVPDPYYGGTGGFDHVLDLIEAASDGLIAVIKSQCPQ